MADIVCARCGEPWDSTGGLHYSHSDLDERDYTALVRGRGCPCCREVLGRVADSCVAEELDAVAYQDESIARWQRSVERLSEGDPNFMYETLNTKPLKTKVTV